jgi:hypothetical protein
VSVITDLKQLRGEVGELVARHDQAQSITDYTKYADDPEGFLRDVLRCETVWSKQVEMLERVRDNPRTLVMSANSIGKDWLVARMALWWVYTRRGFVIFTSVADFGDVDHSVRLKSITRFG